jgi:hypothetical protein
MSAMEFEVVRERDAITAEIKKSAMAREPVMTRRLWEIKMTADNGAVIPSWTL